MSNVLDELRIGVIGCGGRGMLARHAHKPNNGSRIVACCDVSSENLEKSKELYGRDLFTTDDYSDLLAQDIDAIFVCTPDHYHEDHALAALNAKKSVYLEKPMTITTEGCDRVLQAAYQNPGRLYLGHNMRHMTFVLKMKALVDEGAIGDVKTAWCRHFVGHGGDFYFKDWHADRRNTTSLLLQKAAHDIDVLHWLCGSYTKRVNAMGGLTVYGLIQDRFSPNLGSDSSPEEPPHPKADIANWPPLTQTQLYPVVDVEDVSMVNMEMHSGVFASYQQCHFTPDYWRNYTIIGTEGRIENFGDTQPNAVVKLWNKRVRDYNPEADETFAVGAMSADHGGADAKIVAEFVRFARGDANEQGRTGYDSIKTSPIAARYSVATGCTATESLRNGGVPVDVPVLDAEIAKYFAE
ncbi:MAG: Gfo/Idh/MocA family oxidoreductase [Chloroflexota bacterium]